MIARRWRAMIAIVVLASCGRLEYRARDLDGSIGDGGGPVAVDGSDGSAVLPPLCTTECRYVREGSVGAGDGTSWLDAYPALPEVLERGAVYLIADGDYPGYAFDDPEAGGTVIVVAKATLASHGSEVGWDPGYGDGQAIFGALSFGASDYRIDGRTGGGPGQWETGHGIRVVSGSDAIRLEGAVGNITIAHADVEGAGRDAPGIASLLYAIGGAHDVTLSYDYFHDVGGAHILTRSSRNVTLEHSKLARNRRPDAAGSPAWSASNDDGGIVRFCVFEDDAAAPLFFGNADGDVSEDWQIHGNVFVDTRSLPDVSGFGVVYVSHSAVRWDFHHNTIVGLRGSNAGVIVMGPESTVRVYNNLWAGNEVNAIDLWTTEHDHDWFGENFRLEGCAPPCDLDAAAAAAEPSGQDGAGDPFVDRALGDYSLVSATAPGRALAAPFDVDMLGRRRGADGTVDRGALERP